ncbi:MAG: HlyD family efflux transporter periplasmic adaptor subunit [Planctomycetota bacterium]
MRSDGRSSGAVRPAVVLSVAVVAVVLVAGGTGLLYFNGMNGAARVAEAIASQATFRARRGDLAITLKLRGYFAAAESEEVRCEVGGRPKIVWLVDEGKRVQEGDKVLELDKSDTEEHLERLELQEENARSSLRAARANEVITRLDNDIKILRAELAVEMAELEIQKFNDGARPKELRDANIRIEQARVRHSRLRETFKRMPELLEQGFVTKEEVEQAKLDMATAKNTLESAKLEKEILVTYTHPMKLRELQGNLTQAKADLERQKKIAARQKAQAEATRRQREQQHIRAEERLKEVRERLEKMTILAPSAGIVIHGSKRRRWWQDEVKVGATAHRRQVLLRLPNLDTMQVIANVHEAHFNQIKVDEETRQRATVTTETKKGQTFDGYVTKIDTLAHGERGREYVKQFSVTITLEDQVPDVRPGMSANVEILIKKLEDVVYVPVQTVRTKKDEDATRTYCHVLNEDGEPVAREVTLGKSNEKFVEVKEGLAEGESVLLRPPTLEEGAKDEEKGGASSFRLPGVGSEAR